VAPKDEVILKEKKRRRKEKAENVEIGTNLARSELEAKLPTAMRSTRRVFSFSGTLFSKPSSSK